MISACNRKGLEKNSRVLVTATKIQDLIALALTIFKITWKSGTR